MFIHQTLFAIKSIMWWHSYPRYVIYLSRAYFFVKRYVFLIQVLYDQFKFFLNLYFLVMACSQFIPALKIGYLYTYWGPLVSVLTNLFFWSIMYFVKKLNCRMSSAVKKISKLSSSFKSIRSMKGLQWCLTFLSTIKFLFGILVLTG